MRTESQTTRERPKLPKEFYEKSPWGAAALIGTMLVYFLGAGALNCLLWLRTDLPLGCKAVLSLPLFFVAGQGMHLMGWIGHEGLHFTLAKNKHVSTVLGIFFSSMTALFIEMGMALDHWTHHRYTNTVDDPDLKLFEGHKTFLGRLLFTRSKANRLYVRRVTRLAFGLPLDQELRKITLPFRLPVLRFYAALNLACIALFWIVYLAVAVLDWRVGVIGFAIPAFVGSVLSGLRPYIEHNGTGIEEWHNTRTRTSWFWTVMDFGGNYHLEHHLYPGVPQWRLPQVHRYLKERGAYDRECLFDGTVLAHYRYAFGDYVYPDGHAPDADRFAEAAMY